MIRPRPLPTPSPPFASPQNPSSFSQNPLPVGFLGDILSPAVNSRGEVADLGDADRARPRASTASTRGGAPGFIANEVNLTLTSGLGPSAIATASINFTPRSGSNFSLGDAFDADIAQLEWMPTRSQRTSIFVGKIDSVIGIEYRERKANQRFGITPSLIARYTTGTALGLKVRTKFGPDDVLVLAAAVTNGSFTQEQFHFYDEIDTNLGKTASGRVSLHPPIPVDMELGASGSWGAQDRSPNTMGKMWFAGVDYQLHTRHARPQGAVAQRRARPATRPTAPTACASTAAATSSSIRCWRRRSGSWCGASIATPSSGSAPSGPTSPRSGAPWVGCGSC